MKTFAAYISSESGDHKLIAFKAKKKPKSDKEWLAVLHEHFCEDEIGEGGPGVGGSWLFVDSCIEVNL